MNKIELKLIAMAIDEVGASRPAIIVIYQVVILGEEPSQVGQLGAEHKYIGISSEQRW